MISRAWWLNHPEICAYGADDGGKPLQPEQQLFRSQFGSTQKTRSSSTIFIASSPPTTAY